MTRFGFASILIAAAILAGLAFGAWHRHGRHAASPESAPLNTQVRPAEATAPRLPPEDTALVPPVYLRQMAACKADGGKVEEKTRNMGTWTALAQWECVCKPGRAFFGDHRACNRWLNPDSGEPMPSGSR